MSTETIIGHLQPGIRQAIDLGWEESQTWGIFRFRNLHVGNVTMVSNAEDALQRLTQAKLIFNIRAFDLNDNEVLLVSRPIQLMEFVRNDTTHPMISIDRFVNLPVSAHDAVTKARYFTVQVLFESTVLSAQESLRLLLTAD